MSPIISEKAIELFNRGKNAEAAVEFRRDNPILSLNLMRVLTLIEEAAKQPVVSNRAEELALEDALRAVSKFDEMTDLLLAELGKSRFPFSSQRGSTVGVVMDLAAVVSGMSNIIAAGYNPTPLIRAYIAAALPAARDKITGKLEYPLLQRLTSPEAVDDAVRVIDKELSDNNLTRDLIE
jgi:hypothetical protein